MTASLVMAAAMVVLDQLSKHWARAYLIGAGRVTLIEGVFGLVYTENTGAAFGLFKGQRWFFLILTVFLVAGIVWTMHKKYFPGRLASIAFAFILGGALGNFVDRAINGFVVDMFEFRFINFAIFNVADIFLTIGVGLMVIYVIKSGGTEALGGKDNP